MESAKHEGKTIEQIYVSLIDSRMVLGVGNFGVRGGMDDGLDCT
jgi:hypothetical protein